MGVEGVASPGSLGSESAPIRTPLPRAGPELVQQRETAQSVRADSKPQEKTAPEPPKRQENAVLARPGPKRAGTRLSVDASTKRIVAQIVDETNSVIKQIPPEDLLKIVAQSRRMYATLFDEMA